MKALFISTTQRFVRSYERAHPLRKACAIGALSDLKRLYASDGKNFLRRYGKVEGMAPDVREMDISGAERLLFHYRDGVIHLLVMGDHEIVKHYQKTAALEAELPKVRPLPEAIDRLASAGFFTFDIEEEWQQFADEVDPSWLKYLDRPQAAAVDRIFQGIAERAQDARSWSFTLIVGGPGTGKTAILLNLFTRAIESDLIPQIIIEDQVADFIGKCGMDLSAWRVALRDAEVSSEGGILLVDDPGSIRDVQKVKRLAQMRRFRAVVAAVDPLQTSDDTTDLQVTSVASGQGSEVIELKTCYRQKQVVGAAAKKALDAIAASSPFFRSDKKIKFARERESLTRISNDLTFVNPSGRAKVYPSATLEHLQDEVRRLTRAPGMWAHTSPFLIAIDDESWESLPKGWKASLEQLKSAKWIKMSDAVHVKGVEFQHVVLVLSQDLFLQLENGFDGASQAVYNQRRLYRIPLTRAKDSITVFAIPGAVDLVRLGAMRIAVSRS